MTLASDFLSQCACKGQRVKQTRVRAVGVVEEGVTERSLNERFVLENDDHIQLCENSSCSWLRRGRGDSERGENGNRTEALCVCVRVCVIKTSTSI